MRKTLFLLLLGSQFTISKANAQSESLYQRDRSISVSGSAQMEIPPDEIYVDVELKEYENKGQGKVLLPAIRQHFLDEVKAMKLPDSTVRILSYDGETGSYWWRKSRRNGQEVLYSSITYQLLLHSGAQLNELVKHLDDKGTESFRVSRVSHTRIAEYRQQLKIDAIKAAKVKARNLAEAIGEQIGRATSITENSYEGGSPSYSFTNMLSNTNVVAPGSSTETAGGDYQKLTLRMEIGVVFELK